jgi:hypothetical protein
LLLRYIFNKRDPSGWWLLHKTGVQFPHDVHKILVGNFHGGYHRDRAKELRRLLAQLAELQIPPTSELGHLYLNYGPFCVPAVYALNELEAIPEWTAYAHDELGVDSKYLALTSIEGQGITLYDLSNGKIYDVGFGEFDTLRKGEIAPVADTVCDLIRQAAENDLNEVGEISEIADSKPIRKRPDDVQGT